MLYSMVYTLFYNTVEIKVCTLVPKILVEEKFGRPSPKFFVSQNFGRQIFRRSFCLLDDPLLNSMRSNVSNLHAFKSFNKYDIYTF